MTKKAYFQKAGVTPKKENYWRDLRNDVGNFIAYAQLKRACRSIPQVAAYRPVVVGLVITERKDIERYDQAARRLAYGYSHSYGRQREASVTTISLELEKKRSAPGLAEAVESRRSFVLVTDRQSFPKEFEAIADLVAEVGWPDARLVEEAVRACTGIRLKPADAASAAAGPLIDLAGAFRQGRTVSQSMSILAKLREPKSSKATESADERLSLDDLPGMGAAEEWGRQLAADLVEWREGRISWDDVDRGVLLSGPPGTGKTTFARALAKTCGVPVILGSLARWQSMGHMGDLLKAMRQAFDEARQAAPSILFVDELDSFGDRERIESTSTNAQYCREVINGFLECLDGAAGREGVVVVGATNYPDVIDAGILRPGRLDRHVEIPLPDRAARTAILKLHLRAPLEVSQLDRIAARTSGWSGARLEQLAREARRKARKERRAVAEEDLVYALPRTVKLSDDLRYRMAVHEAGHAVVGHSLGVAVLEVSISTEVEIEGDHPVGGVTVFREEWPVAGTASSLRNKIAVDLAGIAAEEMILGGGSQGAGGMPGSDLHSATVTAAALELSFGLGSRKSFLSLAQPDDLLNAVRGDWRLADRVEAVLEAESARARSVIQENVDVLQRLAGSLVETDRIVLPHLLSILQDEEPRLGG